MPAGDLGDLLLANWAPTGLFFPEAVKPSFSCERRKHVQIKSFLEVGFPSRVMRVSPCADFRMPLDADRRSREESYRTHVPVFFFEHACEHPMLQSDLTKVFRFYPAARLVAVPAACPGPQRLEEGMIDIMKDLLADHMAMVHGPSTYLWVEV